MNQIRLEVAGLFYVPRQSTGGYSRSHLAGLPRTLPRQPAFVLSKPGQDPRHCRTTDLRQLRLDQRREPYFSKLG